jgi:hypothetical protein
MQAAIGVLQRGMRPAIPADTPPALAALIRDCWAPTPDRRPAFVDVVRRLQALQADMQQAGAGGARAQAAAGAGGAPPPAADQGSSATSAEMGA